jgi:hypothetical protein
MRLRSCYLLFVSLSPHDHGLALELRALRSDLRDLHYGAEEVHRGASKVQRVRRVKEHDAQHV